MKQFKKGDRISFDFGDGIRVKRLVKKKRLEIYVNEGKHYYSSFYFNKGEAIANGKKSSSYIRTIKFREVRECK